MQDKFSTIRTNFSTFSEKVYPKKGESRTIGVRLYIDEYNYITELMRESNIDSLSKTVQMLIKFFSQNDKQDE